MSEVVDEVSRSTSRQCRHDGLSSRTIRRGAYLSGAQQQHQSSKSRQTPEKTKTSDKALPYSTSPATFKRQVSRPRHAEEAEYSFKANHCTDHLEESP